LAQVLALSIRLPEAPNTVSRRRARARSYDEVHPAGSVMSVIGAMPLRLAYRFIA
jgi:hypothetical protein